MKAYWTDPFSKAAILGLIIGIIGVGTTLLPLGTELEEYTGLDILFSLRGASRAPPEVVIISIDKESADELNLPDDPRKWPRSFHARIVENLSKENAKVIAFDVNFTEAHSNSEDREFAEAIRKAGNVVLCDCIKLKEVPVNNEEALSHGVLDVVSIKKSVSPIAESAFASAPFPLPKVPHKISQFWTFKTIAGDYPTLPVAVLQVYALHVYDEFINLLKKVSPQEAQKLPHNVKEIINTRNFQKFVIDIRNIFKINPYIGVKMLEELQNLENEFSDTKRYQILRSLIKMYQRNTDSLYLNYYGPARTISTIPYYQILKYGDEEIEDKQRTDLKGKAVFIGLSALSPTDYKESYYTVFSQEKGIDISGVEIAATAFANLLEDKPIRPIGFVLHIAIIFSWGLIIGIFCQKYSIARSSLYVIGLSLLYFTFSIYQFKNSGIWYPLVIPLFFQTFLAMFGGVLWNYIDAKKERHNIRKAFGYYLPDEVVDKLIKNIEDIGASQQIVYGICLATDAEKYSSVAELMDPKDLRNFLNKYYETIFKPIRQHGGIIADVVGDSVLAIWIAPNPDISLKNQACLAALDIAHAIKRFNEDSEKFKLPTRIALHSGHIMLGNVGAFDHYEYRPVGDIVNTATRIERLNKYLVTKILISKDVIARLDGFLTRELGDFRLAGKSKPVTVYELVGRLEESNEQQRKAYELFEKGLKAFKSQLWIEAKKRFKECNEIIGEDGPSLFYMLYCEKEKEILNRELWDGVVVMERK